MQIRFTDRVPPTASRHRVGEHMGVQYRLELEARFVWCPSVEWMSHG